MSTLVAQTISNGTVSTSSANVIQGSARAWVNFNGTTATPSTIRGSYNVTSVTKNGTGDYTINFTNAMPNANYSACWSASNDTAGSNSWSGGPQTRATSSLRLATQASTNGAFLDPSSVNLTIFSS